MIHVDHDVLLEKKINTTLAILFFILLLTVFFEYAHEYLHEKLHKHGRHLLETMDTLMKELTILGFISFILFMLTRAGVIQQLNDVIFGENIVEKVAKRELRKEGQSTVLAPTVLFELWSAFSNAFLIVIMSLFLFVVAFQIVMALRQGRHWKCFESRTLRERQLAIERNESSPNELEFWGLHWRFLHPKLPFLIRSGKSQKFQFSEYLSERMNHQLHQIVDIPISTWCIFSLVVIYLGPALSFPDNFLVIFLDYCGILVFLSFLILLMNLRYIKENLRPSTEHIKNFMLLIGTGDGTFSLAPAPLDNGDFLVKTNKIQKLIQGVDYIKYDWWLRIRRTLFNLLVLFFLVLKIFMSLHVSRQEALFPFGVKGPDYLLAITRLILLANVILCTVYLRLISNKHWRNILFHSSIQWIHLIVSASCVLLFIFFWPSVVRDLTFCTSLELLVDQGIVNQIHRKNLQQQRKRSFEILQYLRRAVECDKVNNSSQDFERLKSASHKKLEEFSKTHLDYYLSLFRTFVDEHGTILSPQRFLSIVPLISPNCQYKNSTLELWCSRVHSDTSTTGLTQHEFLILVGMLLYQEKDLRSDSVNQKNLFDYLDVDGDGFITLDDFQEALTDFRPSLKDYELQEIFLQLADYSGQQVTLDHLVSWVHQVETCSKRLLEVDDNLHE